MKEFTRFLAGLTLGMVVSGAFWEGRVRYEHQKAAIAAYEAALWKHEAQEWEREVHEWMELNDREALDH